MATLVSFHAHPDDECIATGGVMAMAAESGHRVVLVTATRGEHGEVDDGFLDTGEELWQRRVEETEAAGKLAAILREENADVLTVYDDNGGYGHPDHIQVHRVGLRAAELAGTPRVYQNTVNRDLMRVLADPSSAAAPPVDIDSFGKPESEITCAVDVRPYLSHKRAAMRAHASQISEESFFLAMPDDGFAVTFGTEWFIRAGQGPGITETDLMAGL